MSAADVANANGHRGFVLDKDVAVPMRDGANLRANVFRPTAAGKFPVLISLGPYGKDVHISQFMPSAWELLNARYPEIRKASSCKYLAFETVDPEVWAPHGYIVVKVDSRGAGQSPGKLDVNSPAEYRDFYDAIEWAGTQPWSNGKVGLIGISYYAAGQWMVAAMRPPHLAAILPWQGTYDFYRDRTRQDGIFAAGFTRSWWPRSVLRNQHGNPESPFLDIETGVRTTGPDSLTPEQLAANRVDYISNVLAHPLLDDWYRERIADLRRIDCPALVVANWGGLGLHLRGTIAGYLGISSRDKWLKVQSGSYFITFLMPENVALQRKFFDRYLKNIENGWEAEPKVTVDIRDPADSVSRVAVGDQWPLKDTGWTRYYLDARSMGLDEGEPQSSAAASYEALSDGVTFSTPPLKRPIEFGGPIKLHTFVSSSTTDMDIFATLRVFDPAGKEVTFLSAVEPKSPVSQGWLRVSHRKLDPERTTDYRPVHSHDEEQPLVPGTLYAVDVEIWPASLSIPAGYRIGLTIQGKDFERADEPGPFKGSGFFLHVDPDDRPAAKFAGKNTIHTGPGANSFLLLPTLRA
jgi:predicted acyl esterase